MQKYTCNFSFCSRDDTTNQLNNILSSNGFVLFVGEGVRVETPISVYFYYTKKVNSFYAPSNLIVLGGKSSCSVNVYYKSLYKCDEGLNSLVLDSTNTIVNKNSYLKLTSFKHLEGFTNFQTNDFVAYQKALLNVCNINIKAPFNFLKNHTVLKGPGSNINLTGLNILGNSGYVKNVIQQTHLVPNCKSSVLFKNIVPDNAKSTFSGLILIDKKAHGTVAKQLNNNMCFGSNVEVYSTPKLEILSNNVRCLHGVTIGGLDSLDTLYAASRCLDKLGVTQLFVLGFINSILKEISIKKIKKLVYKRVELLIKKPYNTTI
jgi:Fe-S cluster assembly protein SufD